MKRYTFLILAFLFSHCTGTKYSQADYIRYSDFASFSPQHLDDIYGCYYSNHGFGGTFIVLHEDSTYFFDMWTCLFDESNPVIGYEGDFYVNQDSLFLIFRQYKIDFSKDSTRIAKIKEQEKDYRELEPIFIWLFKRVGNNIFLVSDRMNYLFGQFSIENRGLPQVNERNDRIYGEFFPLKMSVSACNEMINNL